MGSVFWGGWEKEEYLKCAQCFIISSSFSESQVYLKHRPIVEHLTITLNQVDHLICMNLLQNGKMGMTTLLVN
jgi:hypothetical protein